IRADFENHAILVCAAVKCRPIQKAVFSLHDRRLRLLAVIAQSKTMDCREIAPVRGQFEHCAQAVRSVLSSRCVTRTVAALHQCGSRQSPITLWREIVE